MTNIRIPHIIHKETLKAVYLELRWLSSKGRIVVHAHWLPKSQLIFVENEIWIPLWLVKAQIHQLEKLPREKWVKIYSVLDCVFLDFNKA